MAYGAFGAGRETSDLWVTDLDAGTTQRLTDDDVDANDPQWSPDGSSDRLLRVSAPGGKDVADSTLGRRNGARELAARDGTQFPSDWLRDGSALLVTEDAGSNRHDILVQPADGSPARPYAATSADETRARASRPTDAGSRTPPTSRGGRRCISTPTRNPGVAVMLSRRAAACTPCGAATGASCTTGATAS